MAVLHWPCLAPLMTIKETETVATINSKNSGAAISLRPTFCSCFTGIMEDDDHSQQGKMLESIKFARVGNTISFTIISFHWITKVLLDWKILTFLLF